MLFQIRQKNNLSGPSPVFPDVFVSENFLVDRAFFLLTESIMQDQCRRSKRVSAHWAVRKECSLGGDFKHMRHTLVG